MPSESTVILNDNEAPSEKPQKMHENNLTGYVALWVFLPTIALICCCCYGCEHFEGGRRSE